MDVRHGVRARQPVLEILGVPKDEGWIFSSCVTFGYPTGGGASHRVVPPTRCRTATSGASRSASRSPSRCTRVSSPAPCAAPRPAGRVGPSRAGSHHARSRASGRASASRRRCRPSPSVRSVASTLNSPASVACGCRGWPRAWPRPARRHPTGRSGIASIVLVAREHRGGRLRAPPGQAGEAVGAVAHQREPVGDRRRRHAELLAHPGFVEASCPARRSSWTTSGSRTHCARSLSGVQITTRLDPVSSSATATPRTRARRRPRARSRPTPRRRARAARPRGAGTARRARGRCPAPVLYPAQRSLRNDSMMWSVATPDVGRAVLEQVEHRRDHAADRADVDAVGIDVLRPRVVVPEQLVGAVDEVDVHGGTVRLRANGEASPFRAPPAGSGRDARPHRAGEEAEVVPDAPPPTARSRRRCGSRRAAPGCR